MSNGNLILSRDVGETLVIGEGKDAVRVTVLEIRWGKVRLGSRRTGKFRCIAWKFGKPLRSGR